MVEAEVDFERFVDGAIGDLRHRLAERLEVVGLGLVGEDVAIDEKENALLRAGFPETPDDLKGGEGFACARGHDEQDAVFAFRDGIDGAIDGDELVVAGGLLKATVVVVLGGDGFLCGGVGLGCAVAGPKFVGGRELIERDFARDRARLDGAVVLEEGVAVGAVSERHIEDFGVFKCLLHASPYAVVVVFGLDDSEREVRFVGEDVVGLFGFTAHD